MLNQDLIEKQKEIEKLREKNRELNEQLMSSNSVIEEKDKKISELISESKKNKEEAKNLLSKKDKIEKELKEKIKSMEEITNQLVKGNDELELVAAKKELEDLRIEIEIYKEANSLIREKYEKLMDENPQLRNILISEEKYKSKIQVDTFQKK